MAYKIATWRWEDVNEQEYICDLYSKVTNSATVLFPSINNAIVTNDSGNEDYFDFIVSTKFEVSFNIHDANEYNILGTVLSAPENDIYCHLRTATESIFKGYILPELITIENAPYPYEAKLAFSDGIGKMKDIKFENLDFGELPYYYAVNSINFFVKALQKLDIDDLYTNNVDYFLITRPGYYYEQWISGDPFYKTTLNLAIFTDDYKKTVYECLQEFCRLFHCRIIFSKAIYTIENIDIRLDEDYLTFAYKNWATYATPLTVTASNNRLEIDHINIKVLGGSTITFLPAISQVDLSFEFEDVNKISVLAPYKWDWDHLTTLQSVNTIVKFDDTRLHFEFEYFFQYLSGGQTENGRVWILLEFVIKCGNYYLKRDVVSYNAGEVVYSAVEWTLVASSYYMYSYEWFWEGSNAATYSTNMLFIIDTPQIPATGELSILVAYVSIDVADVETEFETEITHIGFANTYNYLRVSGATNDELKTIIYTAVNPVKNYKKLTFEGIHLDFGDANLPQQTNIDGVGFPTGWKLPSQSEYIPIQNLFIQSVVELRESIRRVQNMNLLWKDYSNMPAFYNMITYDSANYLLLNASYDFRMAEGAFVMMQLEKGVVSFTITNKSTKINKFNSQSDVLGQNTYTAGGEKDNVLVIPVIELTEDRLIQSTPTLAINGMIGDYYEGDFFRIYAIKERAYDILMLSEDIKDKEIEITSAVGSLTRDYQKYSRIIMDARPERIYQVISNPTTTGAITGTKLLPDFNILSLNAIRRKVSVKNQGVDMRLVLEENLESYNDFAIGSTLDHIVFQTDQTGNHIIINFEAWENILPT